jgi:dihydroneopterin aldolase
VRGEAAGRDTIALRGIRAWGHHGANPGEQDVIQPIEVDLVIEFDAGAARASDELRDTIDYAALHATVLGIVAGTPCRLLERLGELILEAAMSDPRVVAARVALAKPGLLAGATPVVTVGRTRPT